MRVSLAKWVSDADAVHHIERFGFVQAPLLLSHIRDRRYDYYISLVGELFERLHDPYADPVDWSRLGNAIAQTGTAQLNGDISPMPGVRAWEVALYAGTAFYFGGYPASAYLVFRGAAFDPTDEIQRACFELLARPRQIETDLVRELLRAVRQGDLPAIAGMRRRVADFEAAALGLGPDQWVGWRLFGRLVDRFEATNIRAVLPDGESNFWNPLVHSLLDRFPPAWDFFPSQIDAIRSGILGSETTYSIQMPTGAGKTALSETLLFHHLSKKPEDAAVLLVPYRSIASELRGTVARRLNEMGLSTRCQYGGTVPSGDEVRMLEDTRVLIATPETLSGLLSADPQFFARISLVICDEGHLIDGQARGVGLELLLARMLSRESGPPKFVFVSAIVPNIEEINSWLGGNDATVLRSDYQPAQAEFAVLDIAGAGANRSVALRLHPHEQEDRQYAIEGFLSNSDFRYRNMATGRQRTYQFSSFKSLAVAAARKALSMGVVAIFAATKRGNQGAVGLCEELLSQLQAPLSLPAPSEYVTNGDFVSDAVEYLTLEYGANWIGTQTLLAGVVMHHGDIPQESREVLESLVRREHVRMAICTNTLAEGVNLPIRTLVLYSVQRRRPDGTAENLLSRDIKNLVGRAGRAGATTKGLVICANPQQWAIVEPVARQQPSERVAGALYELIGRLRNTLRRRGLRPTNELLEQYTELYTLIDGIDATLVDLAAEELGEEELVRLAAELSTQTFASRQLNAESSELIKEVFELRARKVAGIRAAGRLTWIRDTGTRARLLDAVESSLLPRLDDWDEFESPMDERLVSVLLEWAWERPEITRAVREAYQGTAVEPSRDHFSQIVFLWLEGLSLGEIATRCQLDINHLLRIHAQLLRYTLQVTIEQGISLLEKYLSNADRQLAKAVTNFPEHLRFGVPTRAARILAAGGLRHRSAAVALGRSPELGAIDNDNRDVTFALARDIFDPARWVPALGRLVFERTRLDLGGPT